MSTAAKLALVVAVLAAFMWYFNRLLNHLDVRDAARRAATLKPAIVAVRETREAPEIVEWRRPAA